MTHMHLDQFAIGDTVKIIAIKNINLEKRLLGFGIYCGSFIQLKDIAPLGDPYIIASNSTEIAIRKTDIDFLECELWNK
ncbi:MAG: FeoA family protein [Culicoidibacterales bacterium]